MTIVPLTASSTIQATTAGRLTGNTRRGLRLRQRGLFDDTEVRRLWDDHRTRRAEHPHRLWQLLMLELWFRTFIDADGAGVRSAKVGAAA